MTPEEFKNAVKLNTGKCNKNVKLTSQQKVDMIMTKIKIAVNAHAEKDTTYNGFLDLHLYFSNMFLPFTANDIYTLNDDLSDWCWQLDMLTENETNHFYIKIKSLLDE